jgi:hypothetical protein
MSPVFRGKEAIQKSVAGVDEGKSIRVHGLVQEHLPGAFEGGGLDVEGEEVPVKTGVGGEEKGIVTVPGGGIYDEGVGGEMSAQNQVSPFDGGGEAWGFGGAGFGGQSERMGGKAGGAFGGKLPLL